MGGFKWLVHNSLTNKLRWGPFLVHKNTSITQWRNCEWGWLSNRPQNLKYMLLLLLLLFSVTIVSLCQECERRVWGWRHSLMACTSIYFSNNLITISVLWIEYAWHAISRLLNAVNFVGWRLINTTWWPVMFWFRTNFWPAKTHQFLHSS